MSTSIEYTNDYCYTVIAHTDDGELLAVARRKTFTEACWRAQKYSEAFGVICYVFRVNTERHTSYIVKSYCNGR